MQRLYTILKRAWRIIDCVRFGSGSYGARQTMYEVKFNKNGGKEKNKNNLERPSWDPDLGTQVSQSWDSEEVSRDPAKVFCPQCYGAVLIIRLLQIFTSLYHSCTGKISPFGIFLEHRNTGKSSVIALLPPF